MLARLVVPDRGNLPTTRAVSSSTVKMDNFRAHGVQLIYRLGI
jgi:hypothetical protein